MALLTHISIFLASLAVVWFFAGILIEAVARVAQRFNKTGFSVAFFVLGFLTSISELSVAVNATIEGAPQVSAGNLAGASFVILLFIIPFLAIAGGGINLKNTVSKRNILLSFAVIILPVLLAVDGNVTKAEGVLAILAYGTLAYAIHRQRNYLKQIKEIPEDLLGRKRATTVDVLKILAGGAAIFIAANYLVEQAVYFSVLFSAPGSLIGLTVLSIGTNVPELVVAVRSILKRRKDIAFGDYLGSAVANTAIFGLLAAANGTFAVAPQGFYATAALMAAGLVLLFFFSRSGHKISRREGFILILLYALFLAIQLASIARFATE